MKGGMNNYKDKKFHINPNTVGRVAFIEELQKCILLCANCHGEIHSLEV